MWHIKYGQFESERDSEKWGNIHHFSVLLEREGFHIHANFTNYPYSCHFSDVGIHFHKESGDGEICSYSPTGFGNCYDQVRRTSIDTHISDKVAVEILIERLSEALEKNGKCLGHEEEILIREELQFFQIWEDNNPNQIAQF